MTSNAGGRKAAREDKDQRVYFVRDTVTGLIKIGHTGKLAQRLRSLRSQAGNHPIDLLASVTGGWGIEQELHNLFRADLDHGEWFRPSAALNAFVWFVRTFPDIHADLPTLVLEGVA